MSRRIVISAAVMTVALALAGCGSSSSSGGAGKSGMTATQIYQKFGSMTPAERDPQLLALAKTDGGTLEFYSAWTFAQKQGVAFTKKYNLPVKVYSSDNETVLQKMEQEAKAKKTQADVVEMGYIQETALDRDKLLYQGWKPGITEAVAISPGWFPTRYLAFVIGWNTRSISAADAPTSFESLADPKYKGKITIETGDFDWYAALDTYYTSHGMTEAQFQTLFAKVLANSRAAKGHTAMATNLASGEDPIIADGYSQSIDALTAKKAPVTWKNAAGQPAGPVAVYPSGVGVVNNAAHAAAAMLFADFLLGTDGQQIYSSNAAIPADQTLDNFLSKYSVIYPPTDKLLDSQDYQNQYTKLMSKVG